MQQNQDQDQDNNRMDFEYYLMGSLYLDGDATLPVELKIGNVCCCLSILLR